MDVSDSSGSVVVVGAGPAGLTVARLLALRGRRVILIDAGRPPHNRLELVAPSAAESMRAAGFGGLLWDKHVATPCMGIRRLSVEWRDHEEFISRPGAPGFVVDRSALDAALLGLAAEAGVERLSARLANARYGPLGFQLILAEEKWERTLLTQTVVDATGRAAALSRRLGAKRQCLQKLIAERVDSAEPADAWLTFLPMGDNAWTYSLSGPNQRCETWRISSIRRFSRTGGATRVDASSATLSPAAGRGWIAIGDASISYDPICSQGLAHAIGSAIVAAGAILAAGGISSDAAVAYDAAILATAERTERLRETVYRAIPSRTRPVDSSRAGPTNANHRVICRGSDGFEIGRR